MDTARIARALWLLLAILALSKSLVTAVFENCDYSYQIYAGYSYELKSNNYPYSYNPGSSCRYKYTAPVDHNIVVACNINLASANGRCTSEAFYVATDGDSNLQGSEKLCGAGSFQRQSLFRQLVLAYISEGSTGNFICTLRAERKPCNCGYSISRNIANGEEATINEYPSMVALKTRTQIGVFYCGAVIISTTFLLTAAHCALFQDINNIAAWVGAHNIQSTTDTKYTDVYYISQRFVHEHYSTSPVKNDIALLKTSRDIMFSRGVGPICLPPYSNVNNDFSWEDVEVIGWGANRLATSPSDTLQKVTLMVTDMETCQSRYESSENIDTTQLCTRDATGSRKDSCQYDSGSPVIFKQMGRQYVVGIISYGKPCGGVEDPIGVNTRVTSYLTWIYARTNRGTCSPAM